VSSPLGSRAKEVTFFEDRAEVARVAEAALEAGPRRVAIGGVSPYVDERSVQARLLAGEGKILSARVRFRSHVEPALGREAVEALEAEAKAARAKVAEAVAAYGRAEAGRARARAALQAWLAGVAEVPTNAREAARLDAWRRSLGALEQAEEAALAERSAARRAQVEANDELARAEARLAAGRVETPRIEAAVEVEIDAPAPGPATIEVRYRVPSALWRPEHLVRLVDPRADGGAGELEIVTYATAWQRTGEAWDEVEARFSTARPARAATPPLLADDVLATRRKSPEERRRVEVAVREQVIATAGADGARAASEMPGVDDGGEPRTYAPRGKVTIASDGKPLRVEVARTAVAAKLERAVLPEVASVAHLRASATLTKGGPLLAGPLRVARGASLVGRAKIGFVGAGEPFEVGLGPDDGVRVRRVATEEREVTAMTGTQKRKHTVAVHLANLAGAARRVVVVERVPVSEIEDVEVAVIDAGHFRADGPDGLWRAEVDLLPGATETIELVWRLEAASKVVLPP
jgi:uncharacterized protein (TIGR02231 family)